MTDEKTTPIPVVKGSLDAMFRSGDPVASVEASIPEAHRQLLRQMGVREARTMERAKPRPETQPRGPHKRETRVIERGDVLRDTEKELRVVVIKAAAGRTKSGRMIHKVVHQQTGESWHQYEDKLERIKR